VQGIRQHNAAKAVCGIYEQATDAGSDTGYIFGTYVTNFHHESLYYPVSASVPLPRAVAF
jgi:hypothetical protein